VQTVHHVAVTDAVQIVGLAGGLLLVLVRQLVTLLHNAALTRRLEHQAYHDPLPGLGNRALFTERLERALDWDRVVTVTYLDLDDFTLVNDSLGHDAGDRLLRAVADRLRVSFPGAYAVARRGRRRRRDDGRGSAQERRPGHVRRQGAGQEHVRRVRGVDACRLRPGDGVGAELHDALQAGALHVVYQPIVALADRRVVGVEALARWNHPTRGPEPPDEFVGVAERADLVGALETFVLDRACAEFASWSGSAGAYLSVNVSPLQMIDPGFPVRVARALHRHGLRPAQLVVEVTETALATS
jgi:diguanylate cyclase